jgi:uncharacterized membrane protein YdfJ with MMPL/SSD domain
MLARLATFVIHRRWWVLCIGLVATIAAALLGRGLFSRLSDPVLRDVGSESTRAATLAKAEFGEGDPDVVALYRLPARLPGGMAVDEDFTDPRLREALGRTIERIANDPSVARVVGATSAGGERFVSRDRRSSFVVVSMKGDTREKASALPRLRGLLTLELPPELAGGSAAASHELQPLLGGLVLSGRALTHLAETSLQRGEQIALPLVGILLVLMFGSVVAALLPLLLGALSIVMALGLLDLLSRVAAVDAFSVNVVTILGLGVAIDYALFLVSRYREEVAHDPAILAAPRQSAEGRLGRRQAVVRAVESAGRVVLFSGATVATSLAGLTVFGQPLLRSIAIGGMAVVLLAATLAIVLLPAILAILDDRVELGRLARRGPWANGGLRRVALWQGLTLAVIRRPVAVCVSVTALLLLFALPFARLKPSSSDVRSLPHSEEPRQVSELLEHDFAATTLAPISVVVEMEDDVIAGDHLGELYDYVEQIKKLPHVARVDSILSFAGARDRDSAEALATGLLRYRESEAAETRGRPGLRAVVHDKYALVRVIPTEPSDSAATQTLVQTIRRLSPPPRGRSLVYGRAAAVLDFVSNLKSRAPLMLAFVAVSMFIVLLVAFRSVVLPVKAMLMTALSLTASFGAMVFIFQDGRLQRLLRYEALGTIDASLPVVMFAVVFGLSMDYEVLILGRIREAYLSTHRNRAAVVTGLGQTGRLVNGAALLMVVVFAAFGAAPVLYVKALGLGLALAVALDAAVVRTLLVPSTMTLLGRLNWWLPRRLQWITNLDRPQPS